MLKVLSNPNCCVNRSIFFFKLRVCIEIGMYREEIVNQYDLIEIRTVIETCDVKKKDFTYKLIIRLNIWFQFFKFRKTT